MKKGRIVGKRGRIVGWLTATLILSVVMFDLAQPALAADRRRPEPPGPFYWSAFAGPMQLDGVSGANGGDTTAALGFGFGYRKRYNLALDFEVQLASKSYDAPGEGNGFPLLIYTSDTVYIDSTSLFFNVRWIYPMRRFEPFIGGGIGLNRTTAEIPALAFGFIPGTAADDSKISPAAQLLLGADMILTDKWKLGIDARHVEVTGDVNSFDGGSVDLGGNVIALNLRRSINF